MTRLLGPIVTSWSVKRSVRDLLLTPGLIGYYLDETARQDPSAAATPARPERPRSVGIATSTTRFNDQQLPAILVTCPGTTGDPRRDSEGYSATWTLGVTAITQAAHEDVAGELASMLATAGCLAVLHSLAAVDDRVSSVRWKGEVSDGGTDAEKDRRSRAVCTFELEVDIGTVFSDMAGPPDLDDLPNPPIGSPAADPGDLGEVMTVGLTVTPVDEIGE